MSSFILKNDPFFVDQLMKLLLSPLIESSDCIPSGERISAGDSNERHCQTIIVMSHVYGRISGAQDYCPANIRFVNDA